MHPKELDLSDARDLYHQLRTGSQVDWTAVERPIAGFTKQYELELEALVRKIEKIRKEFPKKLAARSTDGTLFDARTAVEIHQSMNLPLLLSANQGFWAWLSLRYFWDLTNWRHGGDSGFAILENFSVTKRRHGLLERLWFRAELGQSPGKDRYRFVQSATDRDFWESGVIRPSYSSNRSLTQAFLQFQFSVPGGRLHLTDSHGIRLLYKKLKRMYATVTLDLLDKESAAQLITALARDLKSSRHALKKAL
jgi:hypothetical protein